jgi:hypothetical protein
MRKTLLAIAITLAGLDTAGAREWVVEAHYADRATLTRATAQFQHVIIDAGRHTLRVATDEHGIEFLQSAGLEVGIDQVASAKLQAVDAKFQQAAAAGLGPDSIPGFQCYRTVEETYQTMDQLAADHPAIVAIDDLGPTWKKTQNAAEGYEMRALRITNFATLGRDRARPKMAVFSSIHAREYAPAELDTRFAEWLVDNYGTDPEATWLVDHNDFHLVLQANPDGRKLAEQQIYQRKNMNVIDGPCGDENEFSQPGIDLNRNFPFHWNITNGQGSSSDTCSQTFRGPSLPGMPHVQGAPEPETQNLMQYVAGTCGSDGVCTGGLFADRRAGPMDPSSVGGDGGEAAPDDTSGFFVDIHSNAALVLWPWGDTSGDSPNSTTLQTLGRRIAWFNDYTPEQSDQLYPTDGTTDDSLYGLLGVPGFTIETDGFDFFQDCSSFESFTAPQNILALRYVARTLHAPYQLPVGPDVEGIAVSGAAQGAGGSFVTVTATIDDTRYNQSNGTQTTYTIKGANAYIDALPWEATATPIALDAADGAFDTKHEDVTGNIPFTGLAPGRHTLYVQGVNTQTGAGTAGPPNAVFFDVTAPDNDAIFANGFENPAP